MGRTGQGIVCYSLDTGGLEHYQVPSGESQMTCHRVRYNVARMGTRIPFQVIADGDTQVLSAMFSFKVVTMKLIVDDNRFLVIGNEYNGTLLRVE